MNTNQPAFSTSSSFDDFKNFDTKTVDNIDDNIIQARNETINNLQTQLNEMVDKLKEMDNITAENQKVRQEKLELESKFNSLNDRFQICLKINENNQKDIQKLRKEKEDAEMKIKQIELSRTNFEQRANQEKRDLEEEIEKTRNIPNEIELYKKQISQLNKSISTLLSISSEKFDQDFQSLDNLSAFIKDFDETPNRPNLQSDSTSKDEEIIQFVNKLKQKNRKRKSIQKNLVQEVKNLQYQLQKQKNDSESKLSDLENQYNNEIANREVDQVRLQHKVSELEKENQRLNEKLKKKSEQVAVINSVTPVVTAIDPIDMTSENELLKQQIDDLNNELNKAKKKNSKMKKQISSLVDELKRDEECQNKLKNQIELLAAQNEDISEQSSNQLKVNEKLNQENEAIKKQIQQISAERDNSIQNYKKLKNDANAIQNDLSQAKIANSDLDALVNQYKNENASLLSAKNNMTETLNKQNKELAEKGEKILKSEEKIKDLQFKLSTLENPIKIESQQIIQIPKVTWFCSELPRDLCSEIIGIGNNGDLQLQDKVKNVLLTVSSYIKKMIDDNQKNQVKYEKEKAKLNEILKRIANLVKNQFEEKNIQAPVDQLVNDNVINDNGDKIFDLIESRFNELEEQISAVNEEKKSIENWLARLIELTGTNSYNDAEKKIAGIQQLINSYESIVEKIDSKKDKIKLAHNELIDRYNEMKKKLSGKINEKKVEIEELSNKLTAISKDREISKRKIDELQNEIDELQRVTEEQQETFSSRESEQQQRSDVLCQSLQREYANKLHQKENEVEFLKQNSQKISQKNANLKKKNEILIQKVQALQTELSTINEYKNEIRKQERQKHKEEMKNTVAQLNDIIENNKLEIESKNAEIQKFSNKISKAKESFISLKDKCMKLEKENKITKAQLDAAKNENDRIKNICETKIKASAALNENNYKNELSKINAEKEARIQELYHFVVETFSNFYDPREQLDITSVKGLLISVKNKLESFSCQDAVIRQTLNVSSNDDVEDMIKSLIPTKL